MCLEMMPSWCRQVEWRNCGIPWVNCSSLCERRLERTVPSPVLLPVKTAQFTQFLRQVWRHTVKSLFNWVCVAPVTTGSCSAPFCHISLSCRSFVRLLLLVDDIVMCCVLLVHTVIWSYLFVCCKICLIFSLIDCLGSDSSCVIVHYSYNFISK